MSSLTSPEAEQLRRLLPLQLVQTLQQPAPAAAAVVEVCTQLDAILRSLIRLVPAPARHIHLRQPETGRIGGMFVDGTLLCADLSGFTAMSAQLAKAGRQGNEEISDLVNRLFATLLSEVNVRGGEVIQFGGDALTAFWDATEIGAEHAALASAAALAMQEQMARFASIQTSKGRFQLRLRIAVDSGALFVAEVGDAAHTELIVTGRVSNRVVLAQERAAPSEVIMTAAVRELVPSVQAAPHVGDLYLLEKLADEPQIAAQTRGAPYADWGTAPSLQAIRALLQRIELIAPYVPHNLPKRLMRENAEGGEFRPVTALFTGFYPFANILSLLDSQLFPAHKAAALGQILDQVYSRAQAVIHRYGGSINKVDMASSGNRMLALFGAPIAHEDDAARAVGAAHALKSAFREADEHILSLLLTWIPREEQQRLLPRFDVPSRQHMGLADGMVFAGMIGTPQRHEYTVMGATVNLAARLMQAAEDNEILLPASTYAAVRHVVDVAAKPALKLKGFAEPVPVFRALSTRASSQTSGRGSPLVGRGAELASLRQASRRALTDATAFGGIIAVVGEAGIGKSRLVDELLHELGSASSQARIVMDGCQSYEQTTPYATLGRLLRHIMELPASLDRHQQAAALQRQLDHLVPEWSRFAPLLGALLNLPIPETSLTQALTAQQRHDRLHDLLVMLCFAVAAHNPLVLVIDDLQHIDASSRSLVERLAAEVDGHPLLLLAVYRPLPDVAEPWRELPHATIVELQELRPSDSIALLRSLLGGEPPAELHPLLFRAEGRPLFIEETLRFLLEGGMLKRNAHGDWVCANTIDLNTTPARVEQLITARLDRLDPETRAQAQTGAVIGQRFGEQLLAAIGDNPANLSGQLEELIRTALLLRDEDLLQAAYRFKSALTRDVAYSSMLFARRRELHLRVATAIERLYADQREEHRVVLAQHYLQAERFDRAFPLFVEGARRAQQQHANNEAIALYREAMRIAPWHRIEVTDHFEDAVAVYENLGDVLTLVGEYAEARTHYEQLLSLLGELPADTYAIKWVDIQRKIGSTYEQQGASEQALAYLEKALLRLTGATDVTARPAQGRVLNDMGWVYFRKGDFDRAQQLLEQALDWIGPDGALDDQDRILNRLGGVAWNRGNLVLAQQYVERSLANNRQRGNLIGQASALNNLSIITGSQGDTLASIEYAAQALEINERVGSRREMAITGINLGWAYYDNGDFEHAHTHLTEALRRSIEVRDTYHQAIALLNLGRVLTELRQWNAARQALEESRALAMSFQLTAQQLDCCTALGELALQQGDVAVATEMYQQTVGLNVDEESEEFGRSLRLQGRLHLAQNALALAIRCFKESEELFSRLQNVPEAKRSRNYLQQLQSGDRP